MSKQLIKEAIKRIAVGPERGRNISKQQAQQIMQAILMMWRWRFFDWLAHERRVS